MRFPITNPSFPALLAALVALAALTPGTAAAEPSSFPVQYMVKFTCGFLPDLPPEEGTTPLKPGNYATAINIHNYTPSGMPAAKRVALHYRMGTVPPYPPVPPAFNVWMASRRVLEVDCIDIWNMVGVPPETFLKGMVHIGMNQRLPVAAVYTAQTDLNPNTPLDAGAGISIDVEVIEPFIVSVPAAADH